MKIEPIGRPLYLDKKKVKMISFSKNLQNMLSVFVVCHAAHLDLSKSKKCTRKFSLSLSLSLKISKSKHCK